METIIKKSSDLRNKYKEISALAKEKNCPIFLTNNGEGDMVLLSLDLYNRLLSLGFTYTKLLDAVEDVENGELIDTDQMIKEFKTKLNNEQSAGVING